mgnify:CR=1 FL=1
MSLPTRERELKRGRRRWCWPCLRVAPHAGARIETLAVNAADGRRVSLPTRERELKHRQQAINDVVHPSLPTRERELKHRIIAEKAGKVRRSPRGSTN